VELDTRLEEGFAGIPGVEAVTAATLPYIAESMGNDIFLPEGEKQEDHKDQAEFFNVVGNSFFGTMGIPMVAGRPFGAEDTATSQKVMVINQSLARKRFPNENPIGKMVKIGFGADNQARIVGICKDTRYASLREAEPPQFFALYRQQKGGRRHHISRQDSACAGGADVGLPRCGSEAGPRSADHQHSHAAGAD
jgi:putative ABC transport system permease protein